MIGYPDGCPAFPKTLKAAKAHELSRWALGDALVEEVGPPGGNGVNDQSADRLELARSYLEAHGIEYATETLRSFRSVAFAFPAVRRSAAFNICRAAGSHEMLASIIKGLPEKQKLTVAYVYEEVRRAAFAADAEREHAWRVKVQAKQAAAVKEFIEAKPSHMSMITLRIMIFAGDLKKTTEEIASGWPPSHMGNDEIAGLAEAASKMSDAALALKAEAEKFYAEQELTATAAKTAAKTIKAVRTTKDIAVASKVLRAAVAKSPAQHRRNGKVKKEEGSARW